MMSQQDKIGRFLFEKRGVRGEWVKISQTWRDVLSVHSYPYCVQRILGELLVSTSLLTATLKLEGEINLQLQGNGPLALALASGTNRQEMRALARIKGEISPQSTFKELMGDQAYLVIKLSPKDAEPYQGIIKLDKETLCACLEDYFLHSEQLSTRLFIFTDMDANKLVAGGILLQSIPASEVNSDDFEHLAVLTETLSGKEFFSLPEKELLWRLYHQEEVTLYDTQPVCFKCSCSRERCREMLKALPEGEVAQLLQEKGHIEVSCESCGQSYLFSTL